MAWRRMLWCWKASPLIFALSTLPRASSLIEVVIPSCRTKSTGFTIPDLEQGTFTIMTLTRLKHSSFGRQSRKFSSERTTSEAGSQGGVKKGKVG